MSKVLAVLKSGAFWGFLTTVLGALSGPPVLAVLPTKWAGALIVVGALISGFSKAIQDATKPKYPPLPGGPEGQFPTGEGK
jgi:hypothetical protein